MRVIWNTMMLQMKNSFARPTFKFVVLFQPIFFATVTYMVYKDSGIDSFLNYVILGTGLITIWSSIVFSSAGDIERERAMGNLEILGATSTPFPKIMYGKILGNTVLGILSIIITFLWITLVFGEKVAVKHPFILLLGFLLMIAGFMGLSMIMALAFTMSRSARGLMNCLEYPIYILTGMVFPLAMLPKYVLPLSWILSPTWVVKIMQAAIHGYTNSQEIVLPTVMLVGLCILYFVLGQLLFKIVHNHTRQKGTLGVY